MYVALSNFALFNYRCNYLVSGTDKGALRVRDTNSMSTLYNLQPPGHAERGCVLAVAIRQKIIASYQNRCVVPEGISQ